MNMIKKLIKRLLPSSLRITSNRSVLSKALLFLLATRLDIRCKIRIKGKNNSITVGRGTVIKNSIFQLIGNNNNLIIGENCNLKNTTIDIISNGSRVSLGDKTAFLGNHMGDNHLLAKGNTTDILIGNECLFSYGIEIRTTDSHSILCQNTGALLNPPCSVKINDHVWVGARSMILKGASIGCGSIIGANSIVIKPISENVIAAGQPARELKTSIHWKHDIPQIVEQLKDRG